MSGRGRHQGTVIRAKRLWSGNWPLGAGLLTRWPVWELLLSRVERAQAAFKAVLNAAAVVRGSHTRFTPSLFASFTRI